MTPYFSDSGFDDEAVVEWNRQREALQRQIVDAVVGLMVLLGQTSAVKLPMPGGRILLAGEPEAVRDLLDRHAGGHPT